MLFVQVLLLGCVALHLSESSAVRALYEPPFLSSDHHGNDITDTDDTFADYGQSASEPDEIGIAFQKRGFGQKGAWAPYTHALAARGFGNKRGMGNKRGFGNKRGAENERYAAIQEMLERLHHQVEREGLGDQRYGSRDDGGEADEVTDAKRGFGNKRASPVRHRGEDIVFWWPRPQQS
ncbi:Hypp6387 [Branchiostoma lanceolatum]|uniref:Hypp6387 protein n=1 Tax=Branchiostoma lanceolatum TaxID=7740 RepID=A0A8J9YTX6_BRALA|nr:Hypp6387 [Branchiostoma lanceolatum]